MSATPTHDLASSGEPMDQVHELKAMDVPTRRLHVFMLLACGVLLVVSIAGSLLTSTWEWQGLAAAVVLLPTSSLPAVLWHDRQQYEKRDAALTLPWIVVLLILIPRVAALSAGLRLPLRDGLFVKMDQALGFNVPAIMEWSSRRAFVGVLLDRSYALIFWLLPLAVLVPAVIGKKKAAERFLLANTIAFLLAVPVFALLPAIGPWAGYRFPGTVDQQVCEASIASLRSHGHAAAAGIVCFPSFHVIWAILSAVALWSVKPLRIVAGLVGALVVVSTVTTGWHYVVDVLAGLLLAAVSLACAEAFLLRDCQRRLREGEFASMPKESVGTPTAEESGASRCRAVRAL